MSYEHCGKHDAPATNGCEECDAERRERTLLNLDNFLASYFGGGGERSDTQRFIDAFRKDGFAVHDDDGANVTMDTLKRNEEAMKDQLTDARGEVRRLRDRSEVEFTLRTPLAVAVERERPTDETIDMLVELVGRVVIKKRGDRVLLRVTSSHAAELYNALRSYLEASE